MRIGRNAARARGRKFAQLGFKSSFGVKQFLWLMAAHPVFDKFQALLIRRRIEYRDLVGPPKTFHFVAVNFFRPGPAFGGTQYDHRPPRPCSIADRPSVLLY